MGEGTHENISEFQAQIKPTSSIMPATQNALTILASLGHYTYLSNLLQNVSHPQPYKHCNKPHVAAQLLHNTNPSTTSTSCKLCTI